MDVFTGCDLQEKQSIDLVNLLYPQQWQRNTRSQEEVPTFCKKAGKLNIYSACDHFACDYIYAFADRP